MEGTHKIGVGLIDVPEKRFRPVADKVRDVADSIAKFGQLQPVILRPVDGRFSLVDGLHRLTAHHMLELTEIEAIFTTEIDPVVLREIELEVNIQRVEVSWLEKQQAIAQLHSLRMELNPNWTQRQTAELVGIDRRADVADAIKITEMIKLFPEIADAKSMRQAQSWMAQKAKNVLRVEEVSSQPEQYSDIESKIILGDSVDAIKLVPSESINLVLTDPPFGIDYGDRKAGTEGSMSAYEDSEASYLRLLSMAPDIYRVLKPDGWLTWFLGPTWLERAKVAFRAAGFLVDEMFLVWDRSEGRYFTSRPDRYYARAYDIAIHCIKGSPEMVIRGRPNIIRAKPVEDRDILVERPVELYAEIIHRLTVPGELVADFFTGSGSVLAAAASLKRDYFGVEMDPERRAVAIKKVKAHTP